MKRKKSKKLKEGDEVLFTLSGGRPIIEKVTVESIDKKRWIRNAQ